MAFAPNYEILLLGRIITGNTTHNSCCHNPQQLLTTIILAAHLPVLLQVWVLARV